jgi:hypothetical protein
MNAHCAENTLAAADLREGDQVVVWVHAGRGAPWSETYNVVRDKHPYACDPLTLNLHMHDYPHVGPEGDEDATARFEGERITAPWDVLGPERLTHIRQGRVLHDGPGHLLLPEYLSENA